MATWRCGHHRTQPVKILGSALDSVIEYGAENADTPLWRGLFMDELQARRKDCPGCRNTERRLAERERKVRNAYAGVGLLACAVLVLGLFTTCSARADSSCVPYSPTDGHTCQPPTRLREWRGIPVCVCAPTELAR